MRTSNGGADQCEGGTPSASQSGMFTPPEDAFDNTWSTRWGTSTGIVTGWLEYEFTSPKDIIEYTLWAGSVNGTSNPNSWTLEYWDGEQWVVAHTVTGESAWGTGESRTFTILELFEINVSDSVSVSENVSFENLSVSVYDSTEVQESINTAGDASINVFDLVSASDNVELEVGVYLFVSVVDSTSVSEESSVLLTEVNISVLDVITVEDVISGSAGGTLTVSVDDSVSVEEAVTAIYELPLGITVSDSVTIGEQNDAKVGSLYLSVYTSVSVADICIAFQDTYTLSVSDGVSVTEDVSLSAEDLSISVSDSLSVEDSSSAELGESGPIDIPVIVDVVSVGEYAYLVAGDLNITVDDHVLVGEYAKPEWIIATGYLHQEVILYTPDGDCILTCPSADIELMVPDITAEMILSAPTDEVLLQLSDMEVEVL